MEERTEPFAHRRVRLLEPIGFLSGSLRLQDEIQDELLRPALWGWYGDGRHFTHARDLRYHALNLCGRHLDPA